MPGRDDVARTALAVVRIVNGTAALLVPGVLLRRLGAGPAADAADASGVYPFRLFGVRTVLIGADLLVLRGPALRRATRTAVLIHAADTVAAVATGLRGELPRRSAVVTTLISATNTALAVVAARAPAGRADAAPAPPVDRE
jgi:hypothetical protein